MKILQLTSQWQKPNSFPPKSGKKWKCLSALTTSIQYCSGGPSQCNGQEKEIKVTHVRKEEIKLSLFEEDMSST